MLRAQKPISIVVLFAVAFVAVLCAAPALAGEPAPASAPAVGSAIAVAPEAVPVGCGAEVGFAIAAPQGQVCQASPPAPEPMAPPFFRRTCRCSCGYPCSTNADCGPGGICSAGITCC